MNFGCAAISRSGRPDASRSAAVGGGMRIWRRSAMASERREDEDAGTRP